jgi:hypothetical protein
MPKALLSGSAIALMVGFYLPPMPALAAKSGGICSYRHCIQRCIDSGEAFCIVGRRSGSSCQDLCKHKGCADRISSGDEL